MQRTAIVSGGAQGIGSVIVQCLLGDGFAVVCIDSDEDAISEFRERMPGVERLLILRGDVSEEAEVKTLVRSTVERFGGIFALINNAATSQNKPVQELSLMEWNRVISVNLTGAFLLSKYSHSYLKQSRGSIINICSTRSLMSEPDTEAYSASKGGLLALNHAMAISFGPDVRVNAISPGWIDVSDWKKSNAGLNMQLRLRDHSQHPVGRVGTPEDIAQLVLFLISDKSGFITGQNIIVDGGMTKKMIYM